VSDGRSLGPIRTSNPVIASEAKQSISPQAEEWIASSLALLAMTVPKFKTHLRDPAAQCPGSAYSFPPQKREQGMPGARCTRGLVCKAVRKNAHEHTGSAETLRHPPRNGFTAYGALSSATNSSCHRHRRIDGFARPGWADETSADLTPATGARTTRFCRTLQRRSSGARWIAHGKPPCDHTRAPDAAASTASHPNVRDDGQTPPHEGMRRR
jgi:hypothetical protein